MGEDRLPIERARRAASSSPRSNSSAARLEALRMVVEFAEIESV
jgi:hypothetical protein